MHEAMICSQYSDWGIDCEGAHLGLKPGAVPMTQKPKFKSKLLKFGGFGELYNSSEIFRVHNFRFTFSLELLGSELAFRIRFFFTFDI